MYYFYCRLLYSLFRFKPSRRRWIFVLRKLPETKPLLVPVRALVHRHRRLRPAFALAVRKRVLEVPGVRLISSDRFSRFIDFGVRHFVVLATGDARFVRLTTFVGLAGQERVLLFATSRLFETTNLNNAARACRRIVFFFFFFWRLSRACARACAYRDDVLILASFLPLFCHFFCVFFSLFRLFSTIKFHGRK